MTQPTAQHTPGPWRAMDDGYIVAEDGEGCLIAKVEDENAAGPAIVVADARLIAAAPDLLAALEEITKGQHHVYLSVGAPHADTCPPCVARAAIRKAKGHE